MTAYTTARARFESWAALDAPHLPADPVDAMQVRLARWQVTNFGPQPDSVFTLGIGEECGELIQAEDRATTLDALGDVCIFAAELATNNRLAISPILCLDDADRELPIPMIVPVGALNHLVLKRSQRIREGALPTEEYRKLLFAAIRYVVRAATTEAAGSWLSHRTEETSAREVFLATAEHVMRRDWRANPATGAATP